VKKGVDSWVGAIVVLKMMGAVLGWLRLRIVVWVEKMITGETEG